MQPPPSPLLHVLYNFVVPFILLLHCYLIFFIKSASKVYDLSVSFSFKNRKVGCTFRKLHLRDVVYEVLSPEEDLLLLLFFVIDFDNRCDTASTILLQLLLLLFFLLSSSSSMRLLLYRYWCYGYFFTVNNIFVISLSSLVDAAQWTHSAANKGWTQIEARMKASPCAENSDVMGFLYSTLIDIIWPGSDWYVLLPNVQFV